MPLYNSKDSLNSGGTGPQGPQGVKGDTGEQGIVGVKGDTGSPGLQGEDGIGGVQGIQGEQGIQGIRGAQGLKGDTGETGEQGSQGLQGTAGSVGLQGIQGNKGNQGDPGTQGIEGAVGIKGDTGDQGLKGDTGDQGLKGDTGDQGLKGDTGATGPAGTGGDSYEYVKCSSAGLPNATTSNRKLPLTEQVSSSAYTVSGDAITVVAAGIYGLTAQMQIRSTSQRLQASAKVYINGVYDGIERGSAYIRNAGTTYDLWPVAFTTVLDLSAGDTVEIYITNVQGASYGSTGTVSYLVDSSGNEIILESKKIS